MAEHIDPLIIGDGLRTHEAHLRIWSEVVDGLSEGIVVTGLDGAILDCNPAFERITGYTRAEVLGLNPRILKSGRHDAAFYAELWDALITRGSWVGELWNRRKDGEFYPERLALRTVRGADGLPSHYVGMFSDISREKQDQARLDFLTHHDALTGFANRQLFMERLEQALERANAGEGKAAVLLLSNRRFLNSEDNATQAATEIGADVCILDRQSEVAVLRGDVVPEGKYAGRRVYNAGINLTHLYYGKIPFLWFLIRDMGFVNKMFRGLARPDVLPDEVAGDSIEKLWISAVETFAIGGGCQILLASDFNIAGRDAYMTLPARKEGIIPAMANLRLGRFVGDRVARQAIMYERRIECDSEVGRQICDEVVDPAEMDATIVRVIDRLTGSGAVGAIGNRRALRLGAEPLDTFRRYAALYAREQAICHYSPALISNLELFWNAQDRKA